MAGRRIRSRDQILRILVGLPDQQSRNLATTMAVATNPVSPMNRGVQWNHMGIDGSGVHEDTRVLDYPLQAWRGVSTPIRQPRIASGDMLANSAPSTKSTDPAMAAIGWLDLGKTPGTRW